MTPKPNSVVRWIPSLTDLAFAMPLVLLFSKLDGMRTMLSDGDTGWHVRIGEWILAHHQVPRTDLFSYTMPNAPFYAWEWLWDVIFAFLHQHGGMELVVMTSMLVLCLTFALLFRLVQRKCANPILAFAVTLLAMEASSLHWLARPHMFSLLLVVIFCGVLERSRENGSWGSLAWLPLLMVLWTNLHGGFFVGLILIATYGAGELASAFVSGSPISRKAIWFGWTGLACLAATFVNPYFYLLHVHIFEYLREPFQMQAIDEFQSISFHSLGALYFEAMLLLGAAAAFWNLGRKQFHAVLLLVGWIHLALLAGRNIAVFAVIAAPFIGEILDWCVLTTVERTDLAQRLRRPIEAFQSYARELGEVDGLPRTHVASLAPFLVIASVAAVPHAPLSLRPDYDPAKYPAAAIESLRGPEFSHSIFTHDEWGDYLIYRMYPKTKVFVDGRSDFYGGKFDRKYLEAMQVKVGWEETLRRYGVDTILLPPDTPLSGALKESKKWCLTYDDTVALIFRYRTDQGCGPARASVFIASVVDEQNVAGRSQAPGRNFPEFRKKGVK